MGGTTLVGCGSKSGVAVGTGVASVVGVTGGETGLVHPAIIMTAMHETRRAMKAFMVITYPICLKLISNRRVMWNDQ
ncbi:MAG: hypothetical protein GKC07_01565 [Methanomicrobiales archaeon]|nr:hypothetical protein [Methanomicrobiales archaeon]